MVKRGDGEVERDESHKRNGHNYAKTIFTDLMGYFEEIGWKAMKELKDV